MRRLTEVLGIDKDRAGREELISAYVRQFRAEICPTEVYVDAFHGAVTSGPCPPMTLNEAIAEIGRISRTHGIRRVLVETLSAASFELQISESAVPGAVEVHIPAGTNGAV